MPAAKNPKYTKQRKKVIPPHLPIGLVRNAAGITLDDLRLRIKTKTGLDYTRGAISAVERGLRGASTEMLEAIAAAYGLPSDAFVTNYLPRTRRVEDAA